MRDYTVHSIQTAPTEAEGFMRELEEAYGFLPNLAGVMAEAPPLMKGYFTLNRLFDETTLSPQERQVVLLAASFENACDYCMAAHSALAEMVKLPGEAIEALRAGQPLPDARLDALHRFTRAVVETRGRPDEAELQAFHDAGFSRRQVLEVILGVGMKTLSNYTNHMAGTPVDRAFAGKEWTPPA